MAHISKHQDKRASTLATADLEYKVFGQQDPYHQRIQNHARLLVERSLGHSLHIYWTRQSRNEVARKAHGKIGAR